MKFVMYTSPATGEATVGVVRGDDIVGRPSAGDSLLSLISGGADLVDAGAAILAAAEETIPYGSVRLFAPVDVPPTFRDFMSFEGHVVNCNAKVGREVDPAWYDNPAFYFSNPYSILGPGDDVAVPPGSTLFDFELEVGAVLGRGGSDLDPADAENCVAGYLLLCDWSARDLQAAELGVGLGPVKAKDSATTLGPLFVTPDELEDARNGKGYSLAMRASVNGHPVCDADWSTLHWSFGEMIAHASRGTRVAAGDLFGSGTVAGGCLLEHIGFDPQSPRWLSPGDKVSLEIERLGSISTQIVATLPLTGSPEPSHKDTSR